MQVYTSLQTDNQWCIAKNGGGYTQRGLAKGLKVHCLFMITEVSIRCQKNPEVGIRRIPAYTPQYTTADNHASTPPLSFLQAGCPFCRPTNSVKALKALSIVSKQVFSHSYLYTRTSAKIAVDHFLSALSVHLQGLLIVRQLP